jgi:hypothetical protein
VYVVATPRKAQQGDHVQVHYVKRFQDGSTARAWSGSSNGTTKK